MAKSDRPLRLLPDVLPGGSYSDGQAPAWNEEEGYYTPRLVLTEAQVITIAEEYGAGLGSVSGTAPLTLSYDPTTSSLTGSVAVGTSPGDLLQLDEDGNLRLGGRDLLLNDQSGSGGGTVFMDGGNLEFSDLSGNYDQPAFIQTGTFGAYGGGISQICSAGYEENWQNGQLAIDGPSGGSIAFGYQAAGPWIEASDGGLLLHGQQSETGLEIDQYGQANFQGPVSLSSDYVILLNGPTDLNWMITTAGGKSGTETITVGNTTSIQIVTGAGMSGPDGFAIANTDGNSWLEVRGFDGLVTLPGVNQNFVVGSGVDPLTMYSDGTNGGWITNAYAIGAPESMNLYVDGDGGINLYSATTISGAPFTAVDNVAITTQAVTSGRHEALVVQDSSITTNATIYSDGTADLVSITFPDSTTQTTAYTGSGGGTPTLEEVLGAGDSAGNGTIADLYAIGGYGAYPIQVNSDLYTAGNDIYSGGGGVADSLYGMSGADGSAQFAGGAVTVDPSGNFAALTATLSPAGYGTDEPLLYFKQFGNDYGYRFVMDNDDTGFLYLMGVNNGVETQMIQFYREDASVGFSGTVSMMGNPIHMNNGAGTGGGSINMDGGTIQFPGLNGDYGVDGYGSSVQTGSFDNGHGASGGVSQVCAVGFELNWQAGYFGASYNAGANPVAINMTSGFDMQGNNITDAGSVAFNAGGAYIGGDGDLGLNFIDGLGGILNWDTDISGLNLNDNNVYGVNALYLNGNSSSGILFYDDTVQTTAGLPLLGGTFAAGATVAFADDTGQLDLAGSEILFNVGASVAGDNSGDVTFTGLVNLNLGGATLTGVDNLVFADATTQTTAGLPLTGGTLAGDVDFGSNTLTLNGSSITDWPSGGGGGGVVTSVTNGNGLTLTSGTLAFSGTGYDVAGAASTAQSNAEANTTSQIAGLGLGSASTKSTSYFDLAGAAAAALSAAQTYASTLTTLSSLSLPASQVTGLTNGTVTSVGMTVPTALLSVSPASVTTSGTFAVSLPTQSANTVFSGPSASPSATPTFRLLAAADLPKQPSITTSGTVPTIAVGAGAGSGGSAAISSTATNLAGTVSITTGTIPVGSATLATITYNGSGFPNGSIVVISPANASTAALSGTSAVIALGTTTTIVFTSGTVALGAGTFSWNYIVIGF